MLQLQESIYPLQLQHRPVFTGGRRQTVPELAPECDLLTKLGVDCVLSQRGGQPVAYPLLNLRRTTPAISIRDYICCLHNLIELHLTESHGIAHVPSTHTGVFLDAETNIGSIGVQVRHRWTLHGFAFNVTREPHAWFDEIVACGLEDVKAGSVESATGKEVSVDAEVPGLVEPFGRLFEREMEQLDVAQEGELG